MIVDLESSGAARGPRGVLRDLNYIMARLTHIVLCPMSYVVACGHRASDSLKIGHNKRLIALAG